MVIYYEKVFNCRSKKVMDTIVAVMAMHIYGSVTCDDPRLADLFAIT